MLKFVLKLKFHVETIRIALIVNIACLVVGVLQLTAAPYAIREMTYNLLPNCFTIFLCFCYWLTRSAFDLFKKMVSLKTNGFLSFM